MALEERIYELPAGTSVSDTTAIPTEDPATANVTYRFTALQFANYIHVATSLISNTYYVEADGSDTTGNGTIGKPLATGQKAIDLITLRGDASTANPYVVNFGAGTFAGAMALPPNIQIIGSGKSATFLSGAITLTAAWNSGVLPLTLFSISDLTMGAAITFDLTSALSTARRLWNFSNINFSTGNFTFAGKSDGSGPRDSVFITDVDTTNYGTASGDSILSTSEFIINGLSSNDITFNNSAAAYTTVVAYRLKADGGNLIFNGASGSGVSASIYLSPQLNLASSLAANQGSSISLDIISWRTFTLSTGATQTRSTAVTGLFSGSTGSGSVVLATSPALTTPTVDTINGTAIPSSATLAVLATAQTFTKAQTGAFVTLTDAATVAVDLSLGNNFKLTLGGNRTLGVPTNMIAGTPFLIDVYQDITGSRTLSYSWMYQFPATIAPTLSTAALSRDQLNGVVDYYATSTVTITIATPGVVTWASHGLISGQILQLTTTGSLPTGLTASTTYFVTVVDANTFRLSTTIANARSATFINTSGTQSGTHTAVSAAITITSLFGMG